MLVKLIVDKPLSKCPSNKEKNGLLCYPKCKSGYKGADPVCWQSCPSSFKNHGAFCLKPKPYGRGAGYVVWDKDKCRKRHKQGCEKNGLLYYPKCKSGFHATGCCICSPNCANGQSDIGISCAKKSYGRGAGTPMTWLLRLRRMGCFVIRSVRKGLKGRDLFVGISVLRGLLSVGLCVLRVRLSVVRRCLLLLLLFWSLLGLLL